MAEKSFKKEKSDLALWQSQKQELNNQTAIRDQEEQMRKYEDGEKSGFSTSSNGSSSVSKLPPFSSETSFLHAPPSYYGNFQSSMSSLSKVSEPEVSSEMSRTDYNNLFIKDLRYETRRQLGLRLDLELANVANWKSVADAIGFSNLEIQNFDNDRHKTQSVLNETEVRFPEITVGFLCQILEELDRQDVITDMEKWFRKDLLRPSNSFSSIPGRSSTSSTSLPSTSIMPHNFAPSSIQVPHVTTTENVSSSPYSRTGESHPVSISCPVEETTIPSEDSEKARTLPPYPGPALPQPTSQPPSFDLPQENYDAFLLFDVADRSFILDEFLPRIEGQAGIKLFIPGRDLSAGDHSFDAQLEAMLHRCPKLIVILSDDFLRSPSNKWGLNVGLALDPAARRRKIIPVIYKRTTETSVLAGINACDRTRVLEDDWFWEGLIRSLKRV